MSPSPNHIGGTTGTLVIAPKEVDITLGNLNPAYDGNPKTIGVTISPHVASASGNGTKLERFGLLVIDDLFPSGPAFAPD